MVNMEEDAIRNSCRHIEEFLDAIDDYDLDSLSKETRDQVAAAQEKLLNKFRVVSPKTEEHNSGTCSGGMTGEASNPQLQSSKQADVSILEIIAEKLDTRKLPPLRKFDEERGESMDKFFDRFEEYCKLNIRGNQESWIEELELYLQGEALQMYKCYKDTTRTYSELQAVMIEWHKEQKENWLKRAISKFEKASRDETESLFLFATKLEKLFVLAYPQGHVERSLILRNKFEKCLTRSDRSKLLSHKFNLKLEDIAITWQMIKKWARTRDTFKAEQSPTEEEEEEEKLSKRVVHINVSEQKPQDHQK